MEERVVKIALCDDEQIFRESTAISIERMFKERNIGCSVYTFDNGEKLIADYIDKRFDAIFLDIEMPLMDGYETARKLMAINSGINIVFISNKETMVYSSYEYNPVWFVPKSQMNYLSEAINKVIAKIENQKIEEEYVSFGVEKNKLAVIDVKNTMYIKSESHYIRIYHENGAISESYRNTLDFMEKKLSDYGFIRCHERCLINYRKIYTIKSGNCILFNGEKIPISRSRMEKTKEYYQKYIRSMG